MGLEFGGVLLCSGGGQNEPLEQKSFAHQICSCHTSSCKRIFLTEPKEDDFQHSLVSHSSQELACWQLEELKCCSAGRSSRGLTWAS